MGMGPKWSASRLECGRPRNGDPSPTRFTIVRAEQYGRYTVALIHYPDCTNFEGNKVLLFCGTTVASLRARTEVDPHFQPHSGAPIARYRPDDQGWVLAVRTAMALANEGTGGAS